jgi:hypothetical protein
MIRTLRMFSGALVVVGLGLLVLAPAAFAQTYPTTPTTPTTVSCQGATSVCATATTDPTPSNGGSLAFTGGNIALLVGLGLAAAVGGVVLVRLGRRSSTPA